MKITFEIEENHDEETIIYDQPNETQLVQQKRDFAQQRSELLKFLTFSEQLRCASP